MMFPKYNWMKYVLGDLKNKAPSSKSEHLYSHQLDHQEFLQRTDCEELKYQQALKQWAGT